MRFPNASNCLLQTFLKLYDGYSEPVAFLYKWSIYGFFWQVQVTELTRDPKGPGFEVRSFI